MQNIHLRWFYGLFAFERTLLKTKNCKHKAAISAAIIIHGYESGNLPELA